MGRKTEAALAVLNGTVGDYLARTGSGLATDLTLLDRCEGGAPVRLEHDALAAAYPEVNKLVLLMHGLMAFEGFWRLPDGSDYGSLLARDLGMAPMYLRYNSGLPIADNGLAFADLLEVLADELPEHIDEIVLVGHSMGGLVIRSACHHGKERDQRWLDLVKRVVYIGSPHQGAPLERFGKLLDRALRWAGDPITKAIADVAALRSAGIQDLGDLRHPLPLLPELQHLLIAGSVGENRYLATFFGDAMVPVKSASDGLHDPWRAADARKLMTPALRIERIPGVSHAGLTTSPRVYGALLDWLRA